jgi:hypothetical protein
MLTYRMPAEGFIPNDTEKASRVAGSLTAVRVTVPVRSSDFRCRPEVAELCGLPTERALQAVADAGSTLKEILKGARHQELMERDDKDQSAAAGVEQRHPGLRTAEDCCRHPDHLDPSPRRG